MASDAPGQETAIDADDAVLLYDGDCRFCRLSIRVIAGWDRRRRMGIIPFRDPLGAVLSLRVPEQERFGSFHLLAPGGSVASGSDALAALLMLLPGGSAARRIGLHRLYGPVAARRGRIGRMLPDVAPVRRLPGAG